MDEGEKTGWQFHAEDQPAASSKLKAAQPVTWTASEFIEHEKSSGWYVALTVMAVIVSALFYLITRDLTTVIMIVIATFAFGILAARKPRVLNYQVDDNGITVGPKFYPYSSFKSFAIVSEGAVDSIWIMPLKRFMPILTIYFAPDDGKKILGVISNHLPVENHELDAIDKFVQKIRF